MVGRRTLSVLASAWIVALVLAASTSSQHVVADQLPVALRTFSNGAGQARTVTTASADPENPFFQSLGTNERACVTCHDPRDGWSITPSDAQRRFKADEFDPLFRPNDGAVCPSADISTPDARRAAYGLLLSKGLIRVSMPVPDNADFTVVAIDDPYHCASTSDMALYRRPLPSTNLRFLSTVMWDGRESPAGRSLFDDLMSQAHDATLGHAQAAVVPTTSQLRDIVAYELGLHTAQSRDNGAGPLDTSGATGGPTALTTQPFFIGINDPFGTSFNPRAFSLFDAWQSGGAADSIAGSRLAVARGEEIFNTRPITITGVAGLNDKVGGAVVGTCTTCHDAPNVGNHSVALPIDIGVSSAARRTPDMPLYTIVCSNGREVQTTDPGRALITGRCDDIGKMKGPVLRGLSARAPYFHNGSAATLGDVVDFYESRFSLGLSPQEKQDLIAFLGAL